MLAGLLVGATGLFSLTAPGAYGPYVVLIVPFLAVGLGMPFTMPAATAAVMEAAPTERAGPASGTLNAARQVGVPPRGTLVARQQHFVTGLRLDMAIAGAAFLLGAVLSLWSI